MTHDFNNNNNNDAVSGTPPGGPGELAREPDPGGKGSRPAAFN